MYFIYKIYFIIVGALVAFVTATSCLAEDTKINTNVDIAPIPLKTPPPKYPFVLRDSRTAGIVAVMVVIDETGAVIDCSVLKSSHVEFEEPALRAIRSWTFKPAKKDGTSVKVRLVVPIRFEIDD